MIDYGRLAEKKAANYLRKKGYTIITGNFRTRFGEIDIIAEKENYIVFAEVKMRSQNSFARPGEYVDSFKQTKITAGAKQFLKIYDTEKQPRFDVIEIFEENNEIKSIKHLENAFGLV